MLPKFETLHTDFNMLTEIATGVIAQRMFFEVCRVEFNGTVYFTLQIDYLHADRMVYDIADFNRDSLVDSELITRAVYTSLVDVLFNLDNKRYKALVEANLSE